VALHPAVRRALQLLSTEDMDTEDDDLAALAQRCGASPAYLSRVFARQVGVPLSRYRNNVRLGRFWTHYRAESQPTITEAMYAAGFGSYAQFYKVFAQAYGCGPRECLGVKAA
jgi:AraC-like DNA-binding protein